MKAADLSAWSRAHGTLLLIAVSTLVLLILHVLYTHGTMPDQDVLNFYAQAMAVRDGQLPYRDFPLEFPPFSLVFFCIPIVFTTDLWTYAFLFGVEMILLSELALYAILRAARRADIGQLLPAIIFTLFIAFYLPSLVWKFDMAPACMTALALCLFLQKHQLWAYALLSAGAMTKFYPVVLIPIFFFISYAEVGGLKGLRQVIRGLVACVAVGLLAVGPLLIAGVSGADLGAMISFHSTRGFQVESVVGILTMAFAQLGLTEATLEGAHFTYDVIGPITTALEPIWLWVTTAVLVLMLVLIGRDAWRGWNNWSQADRTRRMAVYFIIMLIGFMLFNKVFSTQYVFWLFPFLVLLTVGRDRQFAEGNAIIFLIMVLLSMTISTTDCMADIFVPLNLVRDFLLFVILGGCLALLHGRGPLASLFERPDPRGPVTASI